MFGCPVGGGGGCYFGSVLAAARRCLMSSSSGAARGVEAATPNECYNGDNRGPTEVRSSSLAIAAGLAATLGDRRNDRRLLAATGRHLPAAATRGERPK